MPRSLKETFTEFPILFHCLYLSVCLDDFVSLSFVSTIEELLQRKSSGSGLENREYGRGDPLR
jgi:hypothetical protein